jgi:hypothetical protein
LEQTQGVEKEENVCWIIWGIFCSIDFLIISFLAKQFFIESFFYFGELEFLAFLLADTLLVDKNAFDNHKNTYIH